ncbi:MAG: ATP-binding cassette domain-containing protein [Solirubrobacteraceae bacterium]
MSVLHVERLTYTHADAARPALRDVDLRVEDGEFVVLCGLSASGKSTLLRAASGLVPHFHGGTFAGRVTVAGLDTREHGPGDIAAHAGTLFQDPETQTVMGSVRAELGFGLENRGWPAAAVARGVEEAALALGIAPLLDRSTSELSGGELQRVALGAALAGRPQLVLLDEPTSQLDPVAGDELVWLLRRLNEEWGTAIVLAEHRLERCLPAADRVIALVDGAVACDAPPGDFLTWAIDHEPSLATPAARMFSLAGLRPLPAGVKQARATLRERGLESAAPDTRTREPGPAAPPGARPRLLSLRGLTRRQAPPPALAFERLWYERSGGRAVLRSIDLALAPGERVALMGRNGAGKSTLLRHANGLLKPTRGRVRAAGRVGLLLQNPGDLLLAERAGDEVDAATLRAACLAHLADRHPRDLSGGERQRLALAIVTAGATPPAALCLDEPTRGMDRAHKAELAQHICALAERGTAVLVATHDPEFAVAFAQRVVLMGEGEIIADDDPHRVLTGGWYFATETARVCGALTPAEGAELLRAEVPQR